MSSSASIISIEGLSVVLAEKNVLCGVNINIQKGEQVAIVGANGAGKSTLLRALTQFVPIADGLVRVLDKNVATIGADDLRWLRSKVATVQQGVHLVSRLTVLENILAGRLYRNQSIKSWMRLFNESDRNRALAILEAVGLKNLANARVDRLSGGERQKVAIGRALMQEPEVILADEPTASLDPRAAPQIALMLSKIANEKNITLVTVMHTLSLVPTIAKRVIALKDGKVAWDLPFSKVDQNAYDNLYRQS